MEAAAEERELTGERAQRIVDAMRASVATRGATGSTFEHVARDAGVSRGLLHYYFGTKERLLVEVARRDSETRVSALGEEMAGARTVDEMLDAMVSSLISAIENDSEVFLLVFELFSASRRNPEIRDELDKVFERSRTQLAEILEAKQDEGVVRLRTSAEGIAAHLLAVADGVALQILIAPQRDHAGAVAAVRLATRELLTG